MSETTLLLDAIADGDPRASARLLPLVYEELRRLARAQMSRERSEHTLQATALVHEAYMRLVDDRAEGWDGRRHFFAAAAEAMRRILIEHARRKHAAKNGGYNHRLDLDADAEVPAICSPCDDVDDILDLNDALDRLAGEDPAMAELVKLTFFAGLSLDEAAAAMGMSRATAYRRWAFARAWLRDAISSGTGES